jgi:hypothetical protein
MFDYSIDSFAIESAHHQQRSAAKATASPAYETSSRMKAKSSYVKNDD